MYKRILVPTDGSKTSALALQEACKLAAGSEARLRIVHVIDSPYAYADTWYAAMSVDADAVQRAWRNAGQEVLKQAAAQAHPARGGGAGARPAPRRPPRVRRRRAARPGHRRPGHRRPGRPAPPRRVLGRGADDGRHPPPPPP